MVTAFASQTFTEIKNSLWFLNPYLQNIRGRFGEESRCYTIRLSFLLNEGGPYLYT